MPDDECLTKQEAAHIDARLGEILDELKKLHGAFPRNEQGETDFEGHRRYHEAMIQAAEAQTRFWNELKLDVAKKGVWGILIIVCGLVLTGLAAKFGLHHTGT